MDRNDLGLYFKVSGFRPEEIDDIIYRTKIVTRVLEEQRVRRFMAKRKTKKRSKGRRTWLDDILDRDKPEKRKRLTKADRLAKQIDYGFAIAKWMMMQHEA